MRWLGTACGVLGAGLATVLGLGRLTAAELKPGEVAPDFKLPGSDGKTYELSKILKDRPVVLAWFPKAFTSGCTAECKSFREFGEKLRDFDAAYFTASCDAPEKNKDFAKSLDLDFPILSDPDGKTAKAYGVVDAVRRWPQRWTFYIGQDGKIVHIDKEVNTSTHASDVAAKLKELNLGQRKADPNRQAE